jgi:hypothetical protein
MLIWVRLRTVHQSANLQSTILKLLRVAAWFHRQPSRHPATKFAARPATWAAILARFGELTGYLDPAVPHNRKQPVTKAGPVAGGWPDFPILTAGSGGVDDSALGL